MITKDLLDCLKWLKKGVSKNESRRNLMNVEFRKTGDKLRIMSANAFIILVQTFTIEDDHDDYVFQAVGTALAEIEVVLRLNTGKKLGWIYRKSEIRFEKGKGAFLKIDLLVNPRPIESSVLDFPNLDNLIARVDRKNKKSDVELYGGKIKLNGGLLSICLSGFDSPVIEFTGPTGPVKICEPELDCNMNWIREAFIMPIKFKEPTK